MNINPTSAHAAIQAIGKARQAAPSHDVAGPAAARAGDRLELSSASTPAAAEAHLAAGSDVRADKVAAIKAAIADGSYDLDKNLDLALDNLIGYHASDEL